MTKISHALPETEQMIECSVTDSAGTMVHKQDMPLAAVRMALGESMSAEEVEKTISHILFTGSATTKPMRGDDNSLDKTAATFRLKRNG